VTVRVVVSDDCMNGVLRFLSFRCAGTSTELDSVAPCVGRFFVVRRIDPEEEGGSLPATRHGVSRRTPFQSQLLHALLCCRRPYESDKTTAKARRKEPTREDKLDAEASWPFRLRFAPCGSPPRRMPLLRPALSAVLFVATTSAVDPRSQCRRIVFGRRCRLSGLGSGQ
jgi:hypothetical protein